MSTEVWAASRVLFSRKEVAKLLNISTRQLTRLIDNDRIAIVRIGSRTLISREEVQRFARYGIHNMANPPQNIPQILPV